MLRRMLGLLSFEIQRWISFVLMAVPGYTGILVRRRVTLSAIGNKVRIWENVSIEHPRGLIVGDYTSINQGGIINAGGGVVIGRNVLIGPRVTIYSQNHNYVDKYVGILDQGYSKKRVEIGDGAWIAANSTILPGVKIGQGAVVAAGSVVAKDVEEFSVVAGVPATLIRYRE